MVPLADSDIHTRFLSVSFAIYTDILARFHFHPMQRLTPIKLGKTYPPVDHHHRTIVSQCTPIDSLNQLLWKCNVMVAKYYVQSRY